MLKWPAWIGVVCESLEAQRRFYRDVLGMNEIRAGADYVWFELQGKLFELLAKSEQPHSDRRQVTFGFEVDDIHSARDQLISQGAEALGLIEGGPDARQYWAYFKDAEGNLFEVVERLSGSTPHGGHPSDEVR